MKQIKFLQVSTEWVQGEYLHWLECVETEAQNKELAIQFRGVKTFLHAKGGKCLEFSTQEECGAHSQNVNMSEVAGFSNNK